jgi:LysR family hca operon transcriptional activator
VRKSIVPRDLIDETYIGISSVAHILRGVVNDYLDRSGLRIVPHFEIDNFAMAISLVGSTQGVGILPASIGSYLPPSIVTRPLGGEQPMIDLVLGFHKANKSPVLEKLLSRLPSLSARIQGHAMRAADPRPRRPRQGLNVATAKEGRWD